jgi:hypothetical protein
MVEGREQGGKLMEAAVALLRHFDMYKKDWAARR